MGPDTLKGCTGRGHLQKGKKRYSNCSHEPSLRASAAEMRLDRSTVSIDLMRSLAEREIRGQGSVSKSGFALSTELNICLSVSAGEAKQHWQVERNLSLDNMCMVC